MPILIREAQAPEAVDEGFFLLDKQCGLKEQP